MASVVGAALRWFHLGDWAIWVDEAHTWRDATVALNPDQGFMKSDRALYPLAFLTVRAMVALIPGHDGEAWLRLPFAVVGAATVPLLALCGRRLVGPSAAVLASVFLAIDPWHIFWSQNARGYVFVVLAATIAVNRAHAYARRERARDLVATLLAILFGVASHATAWLLVVGFVAFLLSKYLPNRRQPRIRLALVTIVFLALLPWLLREFAPFQEFLRSKPDRSLAHFLQTVAFYFRPTTLMAAAVGLWLAPRILDRTRALLLGCYTVLPFFCLSLVSAELVKVTARYAICALPVVIWLAALAAVEVSSRLAAFLRPRRVSWVACGFLPLLLAADFGRGAFAYHGLEHGQRARWREACDFVRERAGVRGLRVSTINHPTAVYYLRRRHWASPQRDLYPNIEVIPLVDYTVELGVDQARKKLHEPGAKNHYDWHVENAARQDRHLAFMVTLPELAEQDRDGQLRRVLEQECELVLHLPCWVGPKDESVYVYEPKPR